jgi:hypothetical protein
MLDTCYRHISTLEITKGSINESLAHPRDIFRPVTGQSDGTESLIISPLMSLEESNEILKTLSLWAAKAFLAYTKLGANSVIEPRAKFILQPAALLSAGCFIRTPEANAAANLTSFSSG